jgi:Tol biopolymer transport system component
MRARSLSHAALGTGGFLLAILCICYYSRGFVSLTDGQVGEVEPHPSPNGKMLAYTSFSQASSGLGELWVQSLDKSASSPRLVVSAKDFHGGASWSPDSNWISYTGWTEGDTPGTNENQVFRVNVETGEKQQLTHGHGLRIQESTSWSTRGDVAFVSGDSICVLSSAGGDVRVLSSLAGQGLRLAPESLAWSPDGNRIAFSAHAYNNVDSDQTSIWLLDSSTGMASKLTDGRWDKWPTWLDENTIAFSATRSDRMHWMLSKVNIKTGSVVQLRADAIYVTPDYSTRTEELYVARGLGFQGSGQDFNLFRGFHIFRSRTGWALGGWPKPRF